MHATCTVGRAAAALPAVIAQPWRHHPLAPTRLCYVVPQAGDRVLVAEACNHNRITDICNDIGMVQVRR